MLRNTTVLMAFVITVTLPFSACKGGRDAAQTSDLWINGAQAQCIVDDPRRQIGEDVPAARPLDAENVAVGSPLQCMGNQSFLVGSAIFDVTNSITDGSGWGYVNPLQVISGLHTRMHARAFAIESPCNGKRVMYVLVDVLSITKPLRDAVLAEIAADDQMRDRWGASNVMLAATHTHSNAYFARNGEAVFTNGIYQAIRNADRNLRANPQPGHLAINFGELINANTNRSKAAYAFNPESERQQYLDVAGDEIRTNREMLQVELHRGATPVGLINWFGVHATSIGSIHGLTSSDNKGFAGLGFEKLMATNYTASAEEGTFVAAFAQAEEGDSSPNIFLDQYAPPDPARGGGVSDWDSLSIEGTKQLARAIELFGRGSPVTGPVDYQFAHIPINRIAITDPVVLDSMQLPEELDTPDKRTCDGIYGASFGAGSSEDGPGPGQEGVRCGDSLDVLQAAVNDVEALGNMSFAQFPGAWPHGVIPSHTVSALALCNLQAFPLAGDYSCQAEKPLVLPNGFSEIPIQLFRFGQLAVLGLPFEVSTMSGRRIRQHLLDVLAPVGVSKLVVASVTNDGAGYMTTREEYAAQQYEGASTMFGPWTQAAVLQESLKLARKMRDAEPTTSPEVTSDRANLQLQPGPVELPSPWGSPGDVLTQPPAEAVAGDAIAFEIVAGHPDNDPRIQQSYVYVEKQSPDGRWHTVVEDRDPRLVYVWKPDTRIPASTDPFGNPTGAGVNQMLGVSSGGRAEVIWSTPRNLKLGVYRLRVVGASRPDPGQTVAYETISNVVRIRSLDGSADSCP